MLALEPLEARFRFRRIVTVIEGQELQLSSRDAPFLIDQFEVCLSALDLLGAKRMRWPFERGARTDDHRFVGNTRRSLSQAETVCGG